MIRCYEIQDAITELKSKLSDKCKTVNPKDVYYIVELIEAVRTCNEEGGGGSEHAVLYLPQSKTETEKRIARENIGALSKDEVIQFIIDNSDYLAEQLGYELKVNKQNDLTPDGTGTKYPTVDAVNNEFTIINNRIDNLENIIILPIYHYFANETIITIDHNLGQYVNVIVLIGTEKVIADVEYTPDMNSITVRFERLETGLIIIN